MESSNRRTSLGKKKKAEPIKRTMMTKLIDDIELAVLKSPSTTTKVPLSVDDVLILVEYARQCEAVILMMDEDPAKAKEVYKF